jgi:hypothetical protein
MADTSGAGEARPDSGRRVPRWRRILSATLLVLGSILTPITIHTVWIHHTLLDTDQYVATVGPLASNPDVQNALANRITNTLYSKSGIDTRLKDALPPRASFAAPVIANALKSFVHNLSLRVVQSSKFEQLWKGLNRRVHTRLVDLLRGQGKFVNAKGQVAIDIQPIINKANAALQKVGVTGLSKAAGQSSHEIVLVESKTLKNAQTTVRVSDDIVWVLPILTVLAFAGAIAASANRRRTLLRGGVSVAVIMLFFLVLWNFVRTPYQHALPATVNRPAAGAVYDQLISFLLLELRTIFALAVVVALGAWLVGPGPLATRIRTRARSLVSRAPSTSAIAPSVLNFVGRHRNPLRVAVIGLGLVVLVLINHPGAIGVLVIAIVVLVLLGVIEWLGRGVPADTAGQRR